MQSIIIQYIIIVHNFTMYVLMIMIRIINNAKMLFHNFGRLLKFLN